jgi:hypothetical protein
MNPIESGHAEFKNTTKMRTHIFIYALLILGISCSNSDDGPNEGTPGNDSGYVYGKVTDMEGNPLSGVTIYIDNSIFYNSGITATTKADGTYKVNTPQGAWKAYAELSTVFNGTTYHIDLHPTKPEGFPGTEINERNFIWRTVGENPLNPGTYYGGLVKIFKDPNSDIYDYQNIEFTFTPVGDLIDGSSGSVVIRTCGAPGTDFYQLIHNVPIGRYRITAKYLTTGETLKLRDDYFTNDPYEPEIVMDFFGASSGANCENCMYIAFSEL